MSGPTSIRISLTDGPPPPRKLLFCAVVKITLPESGFGGEASIQSQDGKVNMSIAAGMVSKRFRPGERYVYFKSEHYEDGILEVGDRVPEPKESW